MKAPAEIRAGPRNGMIRPAAILEARADRTATSRTSPCRGAIQLLEPVARESTEAVPRQGPRRKRPDGKQRPWEDPPPDDSDTPGMDPYNQRMIEQEVAQKLDQWQKNQGDVPGTLKRFADQDPPAQG